MRLHVYGLALLAFLLGALPAFAQGPQSLHFPGTIPGTGSNSFTNIHVGPGSVSVIGGSANGTDQISNMCVNGVNGTTCPVTAFGARCDGATDDTAAFNLAYSTMMSKGGGELDVPGVCVVNSVHLGDCPGSGVLWLKGITANATLLKLPTATSNPGSLVWSDGTTSLKGLVMKNITFDCNNVHANGGFQNCVGGFTHAGSFEFDDNVVKNWDGYHGVWNLYQVTNATYLNNTFLNMGTSSYQYNVNGVMDIASGAVDTLAQGNKCLSGGKCVFVDEWPNFANAYVNIIGNVSHCATGYAVGNTSQSGNVTNNVYGVIADNVAQGSGNFDSGIIVGGDSVANPIGQTYVTVAGNTVTGITGANNVGIQFNYTAWATAIGNNLVGASNVGTYAYYCNVCEFCHFFAGTTGNFLSIVGTVGAITSPPAPTPINARGTDTFTSGAAYQVGAPADAGEVFLNNLSFQGTQAIYTEPVTLTGGTPSAGTAVCSQSQQGTLKMASCYLNGYVNTGAAQVFNYPTAFTTFPTLLEGSSTGNTCGAINPATSVTYLNLPAGAGMTAETCNITVIGQ